MPEKHRFSGNFLDYNLPWCFLPDVRPMESDFTHLFFGKESTKTTETVYHNRVNLTEFKEFNWYFFCCLNFFELLTFSKKSNEKIPGTETEVTIRLVAIWWWPSADWFIGWTSISWNMDPWTEVNIDWINKTWVSNGRDLGSLFFPIFFFYWV